MASLFEESLEHKFRKLVLNTAKDLTATNCQSIKFLYKSKTPIKSELPGLGLLEELMSIGLFSYQQPGKLIELLSSIDRPDLASTVTEYQQELVHRSGTKKNAKYPKASSSESEKSPQCSHMLPVTLMTVLNINCHTFSLLEEAEKEAQLTSKRETTVIVEVKRDFKRLKESLKKAVATITEVQAMKCRLVLSDNEDDILGARIEDTTSSMPIKPHIPTSKTLTNLSSVNSIEPREKRRSISSMPDQENEKTAHDSIPAEQKVPGMSINMSFPLTKPRSSAVSLEKAPNLIGLSDDNNEGDGEDGDYMNPLAALESTNPSNKEYAKLNSNNMESNNEYSDLHSSRPAYQ